jgi:hypothetical protein
MPWDAAVHRGGILHEDVLFKTRITIEWGYMSCMTKTDILFLVPSPGGAYGFASNLQDFQPKFHAVLFSMRKQWIVQTIG